MINSDARMEAIQQAFAAVTASILMFSLVALSFPASALAEETTVSTDTTVETQTEVTETEPSTEEVETAPEELETTDTTGTEPEETPSLLQTTDIETDTFFHPKQLTIVKELINDNGGKTATQDFSFTVQKVGGDVTYYFDEDGSVTIPMPVGPYRVIEGDHEGYDVEYSDDCAKLVNLGLQNRTCTVTNNDIPPKLTLVKEVVGGTATVADWTLTATGDQESPVVISGQSGVTTDEDFQAGSYTLTETGSPVGYTAGNWDCDLTGTNGLTALNGNVLTLEAGDDITCSITNTYGEPQTGTATVHATKIVCENEADLPNWGADTEAEDAITITATTASDFLLAHPTCHVQEGWQFEWGDYNAYYDLPDNTVGPSDSPTTGYSVFGPTDANGVATLVVDLSKVTQIRLREVMQNGYLHFTHENNNDNSNNVSPEFYCGSDVRNYDNIEYINNPQADQTYYCVAWNVVDEDGGEQPNSCTIVSDETTLEDGGPASIVSFIHEAWATIAGAKWIWGEDPVSNPEVDQTRVFTKTFSLVALPTDADIELAADNGFILKVNGTVVDDQIFSETNYGTTKNYDVTTLLHTGTNTVEIEVKNFAQAGGTTESNPAGVIYKLVITGTDCGTGGGDGGENPGGPTVQTIVVRAADLETEVNRVLAALNNSGKWFFYNDETDEINNALGSFVNGPETAPEGSGSAQMTVTGTERRNLATYRFKDVELADIKTLTFATYSQSAGNGSIGTERAPYLHFNVDFDNSDTWQRRLVYVPATNGVVVEDEWQNWDAINGGNAMWVLSGGNWPATLVGPDAGVTEAGSVARTWNDILADYPSIQTRSTDSWFGFRVGEPYANGFTGNVDDFVIRIDNGTTDVTTTFDFEPTTVQTETTSNGGGGGSSRRSSRGSVAGNSTEGEVLGASCPLLEKYMRETFSTNDVDQVTKLKTFLNQELGLTLEENGVFDHVTTLAVNVFQLKYSQDVLAPWVPFGLPNAQTPTGYVYKTTLHKINEIACPDLDAPFPQLP